MAPRRSSPALIASLTAPLSQRRAAGEADIAQQLRHRREDVADLARRRAGLDDRRQHLQRGDQAVAGGGIIAEDDVARLLAAEIAADAAHLLDDIAVADRGARQRDAVLPRCRSKPRLDITVATMPLAGEAPGCHANRARSAP